VLPGVGVGWFVWLADDDPAPVGVVAGEVDAGRVELGVAVGDGALLDVVTTTGDTPSATGLWWWPGPAGLLCPVSVTANAIAKTATTMPAPAAIH
jgi:hypothetical protein